jgi:probable HAF family extracellular repeat protein
MDGCGISLRLRGDNSGGLGLNDHGQVVGDSNARMHDLGVLGGIYTVAKAINNWGIIVGSFNEGQETPRAFIYDGQVHDMQLGTIAQLSLSMT